MKNALILCVMLVIGLSSCQRAEQTTEEVVLGSWLYEEDMDGTMIRIDLQINEDGTYKQDFMGYPSEGTWEMLEDNFLRVKSPEIMNEEGQKWKIVQLTKDSMWIDWNVSGGEEKVMGFKRQ
jgi:hypothetical protein